MCDELKSYSVLEGLADCIVKDINTVDGDGKGFFNLNTVNNFHSFIKKRYNHYRGVATKYLNRYNALFTLVWRQNESLLADLCAKLFQLGTKSGNVSSFQLMLINLAFHIVGRYNEKKNMEV